MFIHLYNYYYIIILIFQKLPNFKSNTKRHHFDVHNNIYYRRRNKEEEHIKIFLLYFARLFGICSGSNFAAMLLSFIAMTCFNHELDPAV